MEKTLIISLISEQTVPNIQFMKWYWNEHISLQSDLLFISTEEMEKKEKSKLIIDTLNYVEYPYDSYGLITVNENSISDMNANLSNAFNSDLNELDINSYEKVVLNMTGGTKIMSLAAYLYFKKIDNLEIYYQPFNKDLIQLYPIEKTMKSATISLTEALLANGFSAEETGEELKDYEFNKNFYKECLKENRSGLKVIVLLGNARNNGKKTFNILEMKSSPKYTRGDVNNAIKIAKYCGFDPSNITGEQIAYITGGWFEEYVFQYIMNQNKIPKENIALNMKVERGNDKNELDVVYMSNDSKLHIVECKALIEKAKNSTVINDAIYKLKSLTTKFGLKVQGYVYTMATTINDVYYDRASDLSIKIEDGNELQKRM